MMWCSRGVGGAEGVVEGVEGVGVTARIAAEGMGTAGMAGMAEGCVGMRIFTAWLRSGSAWRARRTATRAARTEGLGDTTEEGCAAPGLAGCDVWRAYTAQHETHTASIDPAAACGITPQPSVRRAHACTLAPRMHVTRCLLCCSFCRHSQRRCLRHRVL